MTVVWVTGNSGVGKSTVCELLEQRGHEAIDADWEGYNRWVDRLTGEVVVDPPYPVPRGWLHRYGWKITRADVEALAARAAGRTVFLCGSVENENEVRDLFDVVICLVIDVDTLISRLADRTKNAFGAHPEELAAAVRANATDEAAYRDSGATIIDATRPLDAVAEAVLEAAGLRRP
ncbi:AAA family ATPase [Cryptosporangium sp. NPDC051539]|uniref:AAA family ATPase n=1 Tax=Cryptosporangium sp. NPDC051539 TaxID=3363962 RepID=UPI0037BCBCD7